MRVIVVDDDPSVVIALEGCLQALGYEVAVAGNGGEAMDLLRADDYRIVITDWEMPEVNGLDLCHWIRERKLGPYVYILLLTSRDKRSDLIEGLSAGADDFITKPFEPNELRVRLRAAERIVGLESRDLVIFSLARLAESRDRDTGAHLERIREYSRTLAEELAGTEPYRREVDADYVQAIYVTSPLHDIGKVGIPDHILLKPARLTDEEFEIMKQHSEIGRATLEDALQAYPSAGFLRVARDIAWTHHERWDGSGYPRGLKEYETPLCGRIVAVADVYDALTSRRPYKEAFSHEVARREIVEGCGSAFDPGIVAAFLRREKEFIRIKAQYESAEAAGNKWTTPLVEACR
jgi:putative two-component system response regulator